MADIRTVFCMTRQYFDHHPSLPAIVTDLRNGVGPTAVARKYNVSLRTCESWWLRNKADLVKLDSIVAGTRTPEAVTQLIEKEQRQRANLELELEEARTLASVAEQNLSELTEKYADFDELMTSLHILDKHVAAPPVWLEPSKADEKHGTVCAVLSDLHLDEVVRKQEVGSVNAYNRRIAEMRLRRFFEKAIELPRDYLSNIEYDGFVLMCLGDTFTGEIHEELAMTNEGHPFETALYFIDHFVAGIRLLADHYGKVHVVSVPGNHDRTYKKPRYKGRVVTSMHYLFMKFVEREFAGDERVTFQAPETPDAVVKIYDTTYLCTHGDQFKGGNGVGGIMVPLLRGHLKTQQRQQAIRQGYDVMVMGHWHQYLAVPSSGLIINGSLKGYDEFAYGHGFNYEPAQQALWVTTPEHGATGFHLPIVVQDKKNERW